MTADAPTNTDAEERRFLVRSMTLFMANVQWFADKVRDDLAQNPPTGGELEALRQLHAELIPLCTRISEELESQRKRAAS